MLREYNYLIRADRLNKMFQGFDFMFFELCLERELFFSFSFNEFLQLEAMQFHIFFSVIYKTIKVTGTECHQPGNICVCVCVFSISKMAS
jgi:hypothetical protein